MIQNSELKPCPLCECDDINVEVVDMSTYKKTLIDSDEGKWYSCWCNECMASTSDFLTQEDAEEAWNKRYTPKTDS